MPIQQDQLSPLRTTVTFEDINTIPSARILHNGSDFIKCIAGAYKAINPIMRYYTTAGERASSYTMDSDYVLDIAYEQNTGKYYQIRHKLYSGSTYYLALDEIDDEGRIVGTIVENLDILPNGGVGATFNPLGVSGIVTFCVDDNTGAFIKVYDDVYRVSTVSGNFTPASGIYNESSPYIAVSSGIIQANGVSAFQFNETATKFLQYIVYDDNTQEVRLETLNITGSGAPTSSDRKVFLDIPDWEEHYNTAASGFSDVVDYVPCVHGVDHNTLFYFRKHGDTGRNLLKTDGTDGTISAGTTLDAPTADFVSNDVKEGDVLHLSYDVGGNPTIKVVEVTSVVDEDTVVISESITPDGSVSYEAYSNADQLQFNTDPDLSAFASVNVEDFSLRAGTSDTTNVIAEVINAWGDPLNGKTVNFIVTNGDGVVNPAQDTTNISGVATSQYSAGTTPGAVEISIIVSD